jgi:DnaJ-class molecular chaperone
MKFKDYYEVMGVPRGATQDEIKRSYRKLARKFHPDVSKEKDAEDRFKELQEAYEVLKDPEKRAAYDQLGANWRQGQDFRPPPDWGKGFEFTAGRGGVPAAAKAALRKVRAQAPTSATSSPSCSGRAVPSAARPEARMASNRRAAVAAITQRPVRTTSHASRSTSRTRIAAVRARWNCARPRSRPMAM